MNKIYLITSLLLVFFTIQAQESEKKGLSFDLGAEMVSSYVWRGAYQTSVAIQPAVALNAGGFSLSAWGSVPFSGTAKEVDFTIGYEMAGCSLSVTDYWWAGENVYKYFEYGAHDTEHHFEASVSYALPMKKCPLALSWNTLFAGEDYYKAKGKRAYSTYVTAAFPFAIKTIRLEAEVGITPWESMYADDFAVVSAGIKASKEIRITERFVLPVSAQVLANPKKQDIFFVFGLSL